MRIRTERLRSPGVSIVLGLGVAVLIAAVTYWITTPSPTTAVDASTQAPQTPDIVVPAQPAALWVGDSFTAGVNGVGQGSYARLICLRMGWACNVDAEGSTGFINEGIAELRGQVTKLPDRLEFDKKTYLADVVIVDGGRNDLANPVPDVLAAAGSYVDEVHATWPDAAIVLVVPTFMTPEKYPDYDEMVEGYRALAARVGGKVIDQIGGGWWNDADLRSMQISDGVHPNAQGNAYMAYYFEQALRASGVADIGKEVTDR